MAKLALIGGDLLGRGRVEQAARGLDVEVVTAPAGAPPPAADAYVLDLDVLGEGVRSYAGAGPAIGYFSHLNGDAARAAREAGVKPIPRSRFWRELPDLLRLLIKRS